MLPLTLPVRLPLPTLPTALLLLTTTATAQVTWTPVTVGQPPARSAAGAATTRIEHHTILFGGLGPAGALGDTWGYDNQTWTQLTPAAAPTPRSHVAMAAIGRDAALFGGRDAAGTALGDLWIWSTAAPNWTPGPAGPLAREGAAMAGGPSAMLFGGRNGATTFGDTWRLVQFPTPTWTDVSPPAGPAPRHGHAMVMGVDHAMYWLLFGGRDAQGNHLADTWRLDQVSPSSYAWTRIVPLTSPSPRAGHGMRFSPHRARVQLFGGEGPGGLLSDTWEWDGATWLPITTNGAPAARADAPFVDGAHDPNLSPWSGLLVGGRNAAGPIAEVWAATSTIPATADVFGGPLVTPLYLSFGSMPWIGGTFDILVHGVAPVIAPHVMAGFSNTTSPYGPLPLNIGPAFNNMTLYVDPVVLLPGSPSAAMTSRVTVALPAVPAFVGQQLYLQGIGFVPALGPVAGAGVTLPFACQLGWR